MTGKRVSHHFTKNAGKDVTNYPDDYVTFPLSDVNIVFCATTVANPTIVCISGFAGGNDNGMTHLVSTLQKRLKSTYGFNTSDVIHMQWNTENKNPTLQPQTDRISKVINERLFSAGNYLAIIGHSFGGWAACRVSQKTNIQPDFVGLIDPVFGPGNIIKSVDIPRGKRFLIGSKIMELQGLNAQRKR